MNKLVAVFIIILLILPAAVYPKDPTSKAECIAMLKPALQSQCNALFGADPEKKALCVENIVSETESQCSRFFSDNFCSTCTSECINQYQAGDPTRKSCLNTCLNNPACK